MSAIPVRYGEHVPVPAWTPCEACKATSPNPIADHCHAHGWVRAALCRSCNTRMALLDRGITPRGDLTSALIEIASRCPDCAPVNIKELAPRGSLCSVNRNKPLPNTVTISLRFPEEDLYDRIKAKADAARRSFGAQIVWLLEQSLKEQKEQQ